MHLLKSLSISALSLGFLAACGGGETADPNAGAEMLDNGMTVKAQIEARQEGFKAIGKNFKTISDQLKAGSPDIAAIQAASSELSMVGADMDTWFPEGTGPESGVETEALALIWQELDDFNGVVMDSQTALDALDAAAQTGDVAAISAAFQTAGGTCKACHDKFRLDD